MTFAEAQDFVRTDPLSGIGQMALLIREGLTRESSVLEIGCGTLNLGRVLIPWLNADRYHGIDPNTWLRFAAWEANPEMMEACARQHATFSAVDNFRWRHARTFDVIFSHSVLSHTSREQLGLFMDAVRDQLADGGFCLASINLHDASDTAEACWAYPHGVWVSRERLRRTAEERGLTVEERPNYSRTMMALRPEESHCWIVLR